MPGILSDSKRVLVTEIVADLDPIKDFDDDEKQRLQVKFTLLPDTKDAQFQKDFPCYVDGLVFSSPGRYVTMPEYPKKAECVYNLKPRPDDVYVLTFPKCGNTCFVSLRRLLYDCHLVGLTIKTLKMKMKTRDYLDARTCLAGSQSV